MKDKTTKQSLIDRIQDRLLMKQVFLTLVILITTFLTIGLSNVVLLFPSHKVLTISYYFSYFPETLKVNLIIISFTLFLIFFKWVHYWVYQPKLELSGEKGTADWANEKIEGINNNEKLLLEEEKLVKISFNEISPNKRGIILTTDDKHYYVDPNTTHNVVLGITGAGKSQTSVFPFIDLISRVSKNPKSNLIQESMIINDPKGELCSSTASLLKERVDMKSRF